MIKQILTKAAPTSVMVAALAGAGNVSAEGREPVDALLDCTIQLTYNRMGDEHTLQQLAYMVQTAITEEVNESTIVTYVNQCRNLGDTLKGSPKAAKKEYLAWIDGLPNPKSTRKLLTGFVAPRHKCQSLGFHGGINFLPYGIAGGNLGLDLAACESSVGHTWVEARPYMEATTGFSPFGQRNIFKRLRWGFHAGEEQAETAVPEKFAHGFHGRLSTDLQAYLGLHLGTLVNDMPNAIAYQGGFTFSLSPAATFGVGLGSSFRFGLESGEYGHLKRSVLEQSDCCSLTFSMSNDRDL